MWQFVANIAGAAVASMLLCGGVIYAAIKYGLKTYVDNAVRHRYDLALTKVESELKAKHDVAIEKLRADLQISAASHQIQFSRIDEEIGNYTAEAYKRLVNFQNSVEHWRQLVGSNVSKQDRQKAISKAYDDFRDYVFPRAIYLPAETMQLIDQIDKVLKQLVHESHFDTAGIEESKRVAAMNNFATRYNANQKLFETLKTQLVDDFRKLRGLQWLKDKT
jgi:hypothetical protein